MHFFKILFLLSLVLGMDAVRADASGGDSPALAELFCEAELSARSQGRPIAESDQDWQIVSKTLLERRLIKVPPEHQAQGRIADCMTKYRSDFEEGELILRGLDLLELTAQREQQVDIADASRPDDRKKDEHVLAQVNEDVLAGLVPEPQLAKATEGGPSDREAIQQALQVRRENYLKLWNEFTRKLRDKVFHTTIARSTDSTRRRE